MNIAIIVGSTRKGRVSHRLAAWVKASANRQASHRFNLIDLAEYDLPIFNEPVSPQDSSGRDVSATTAAYLKALSESDGFVIVTPEYNHAIPGVLKNALDLVDFQLVRKPVAIVSHGSVGGARANEQLRLVVNSSLGAVPIPKSLTFMGKVDQAIDEAGNLRSEFGPNAKKLTAVIDELLWYTAALKEANSHEAR